LALTQLFTLAIFYPPGTSASGLATVHASGFNRKES